MKRDSINTQRLTVFAQDPTVHVGGKPLMATIEVPAELVSPGPTGYRIKVVDYDSSANRYYTPHEYQYDERGAIVDPFEPPPKTSKVDTWTKYLKRVVGDPTFHCQNAYAISMRTLARFEFALGRRIHWGFKGHQLHIAPHAFDQANAFYSRADRSLLFGYFQPTQHAGTVFACLSHDVVAHETSHALLDGLRSRYTEPSAPDQAGFHEGFADIVALLSVFSLEEVVASLMSKGKRMATNATVKQSEVEWNALAKSALLGMAEQMGSALSDGREDALRRSVEQTPSPKYLLSADYSEPHNRGEILVAAFMRSFLDIWVERIQKLSIVSSNLRSLDLVVEEGAKVAEHLLTMAIRALDYCPPVDLEFGDYITALLTSDHELVPDDSRFKYRGTLAKNFKSFGIVPPVSETTADGNWKDFSETLKYSRNHYESMLYDREEVFRFIWENRGVFQLDNRGYTEVESVRASRRIGPDGFILRETVAEYVQISSVWGNELLPIFGIQPPKGLAATARVKMFGGGTLVFDEYGKVKYHINKPLGDIARQTKRIEYLAKTGLYSTPIEDTEPFSALHRARMLG